MVPQVVRTTSKSELQDQKSVVYQDSPQLAELAPLSHPQLVRVLRKHFGVPHLLVRTALRGYRSMPRVTALASELSVARWLSAR